MRRNNRLRQLRWVMIATMCADFILTLIGQPGTYWHNPSDAVEANGFFAAAMQHGWVVFVLAALICGAAIVFVSTIVRERVAIVVILAATLSSFFGASSWLVYRFGFGSMGEILLAILLSIALVKAGLSARGL